MAIVKRRVNLENIDPVDEPEKYLSIGQAFASGIPVNEKEREKAVANMLNLPRNQVFTKDGDTYYMEDPGSGIAYKTIPDLKMPTVREEDIFGQFGDLARTGAYYGSDIFELGLDAIGSGLLAKKFFPGLAQSKKNVLNRFVYPALGFGGISGGVNLARQGVSAPIVGEDFQFDAPQTAVNTAISALTGGFIGGSEIGKINEAFNRIGINFNASDIEDIFKKNVLLSEKVGVDITIPEALQSAKLRTYQRLFSQYPLTSDYLTTFNNKRKDQVYNAIFDWLKSIDDGSEKIGATESGLKIINASKSFLKNLEKKRRLATKPLYSKASAQAMNVMVDAQTVKNLRQKVFDLAKVGLLNTNDTAVKNALSYLQTSDKSGTIPFSNVLGGIQNINDSLKTARKTGVYDKNQTYLEAVKKHFEDFASGLVDSKYVSQEFIDAQKEYARLSKPIADFKKTALGMKIQESDKARDVLTKKLFSNEIKSVEAMQKAKNVFLELDKTGQQWNSVVREWISGTMDNIDPGADFQKKFIQKLGLTNPKSDNYKKLVVAIGKEKIERLKELSNLLDLTEMNFTNSLTYSLQSAERDLMSDAVSQSLLARGTGAVKDILNLQTGSGLARLVGTKTNEQAMKKVLDDYSEEMVNVFLDPSKYNEFKSKVKNLGRVETLGLLMKYVGLSDSINEIAQSQMEEKTLFTR